MNFAIGVFVVAASLAIFISVYTDEDRDIAYGTSVLCERGVSYLVIRGYNRLGVSVMFNTDGEIITCE